MPTSYIYSLPRFPQGNVAEIDISIKVYRQFILSLQDITWFSFPSREERSQQSGWFSGGDREADAHTTPLTLTAMLSQSWAHMAVIWVAHPCPFPSARPQKMVRANTLSISRVWSTLGFPSFFRSPSCHPSWLVRIQWGVSEESSDVFCEPVSLPYVSSLAVYLHLKHHSRLDGECQKWGDGLLEN